MSAALSRPAQAATVPVPISELLVVAREYVDASRFDAAERLLGHVLATLPNHAETLHLRGYIAFKRGNGEEAATLMEQALAAGARSARQYCNLAEVYRLIARLDDGLVMVRRATALAPMDPVCHFNEAMVRFDRLEIADCIRAARRAIALRPDMPEAHMRLGQSLLLQGSFAEGWDEYEWRYKIAGAQALMPKTDKPQWDGSKLPDDKGLLLIADQGFGDVMMFARYLPWAQSRASRIAVACSPEMNGMLARLFPGPTYFTHWEKCPPYVAFCPYSGLPRLHGTRLESIPQPGPYFRPEPGRLAAWRERLDRLLPAGLRRVGIVWSGRPTHNNDRNRSIKLERLAPLAKVPGIVLVSLQKGPPAAQCADWAGPAPLVNLDPQIESFEDTAAILAQLDLLVCVDTSVGHLAGALGKPAWLMLPFAPDWRWLMARPDSPWYPTLRLFRQTAPRAWGPLIESVAGELAAQ
jgi:hypothetical protein